MRPRSIHKIHKWIALSAALFLLGWLISGAAMVIPDRWLTRPRLSTKSSVSDLPASFSRVSVTVPEAIAAVRDRIDPHAIRRLSLVRRGDSLVWEVETRDRQLFLVDGFDGEILEIEESSAEARAKALIDSGAEPVEKTLLEERDRFYRGPIPAFSFRFDDFLGSVVYVSMADGQTQISNRLTRIRHALTRLHSFEPLSPLLQRTRWRVGLVLGASLLGLTTVVSGLYLAWPSKRPVRRDDRT